MLTCERWFCGSLVVPLNFFRGAACSKGPAASSGGSRGLVARSRAGGGGGGGGGGGASESKGSPAPAPAPQTKGLREWRPCVACRVCSSACVLSCSRGWSRTVEFGVLRGSYWEFRFASLSGNVSPIMPLCLGVPRLLLTFFRRVMNCVVLCAMSELRTMCGFLCVSRSARRRCAAGLRNDRGGAVGPRRCRAALPRGHRAAAVAGVVCHVSCSQLCAARAPRARAVYAPLRRLYAPMRRVYAALEPCTVSFALP